MRPPVPKLRSLRLPAVLLAAALAAGCLTTEIRRPIAASSEIQVGSPATCWEVVARTNEPVGLVVFFEGSTPKRSLYMVRNIWHQDLGLIDAFGRAYRYLPHHKSPAWVGTGTVRQGVERILEQDDCTLFEVPFRESRSTTEAATREVRPQALADPEQPRD